MMALAGVPGLAQASIVAGKAPDVAVLGIADAESKVPVRVDTLFEAASLSKPTVAYVTLLMADRGKLELGSCPKLLRLPHKSLPTSSPFCYPTGDSPRPGSRTARRCGKRWT